MYARGTFRLQVLVTHNCNARCEHCDKAVGYSNLSDLDMTADDMRRAVDRMIAEGVRIPRISLSGGEPVLNPEFQGIVNETARVPGMEHARLLTNDMPISKAARDRIELPDERFEWAPAPLDDPNDYKSGKNDPSVRHRGKVHIPYWVSPADLGLETSFRMCGVRKTCGRGLDTGGWSMCGQAPILGRLLGISPYDDSLPIADQVNRPVRELCRHCIYGLQKAEQRRIAEEVNAGELPAISETFQAAFASEPQLFNIEGVR